MLGGGAAILRRQVPHLIGLGGLVGGARVCIIHSHTRHTEVVSAPQTDEGEEWCIIHSHTRHTEVVSAPQTR